MTDPRLIVIGGFIADLDDERPPSQLRSDELTDAGRNLFRASMYRTQISATRERRPACLSTGARRPRGRSARRTVRRVTTRSGSRGDPDLSDPDSKTRERVA